MVVLSQKGLLYKKKKQVKIWVIASEKITQTSRLNHEKYFVNTSSCTKCAYVVYV